MTIINNKTVKVTTDNCSVLITNNIYKINNINKNLYTTLSDYIVMHDSETKMSRNLFLSLHSKCYFILKKKIG